MRSVKNQNFTVIEIGNDTTKMISGSFSDSKPYIFCLKEVKSSSLTENGSIQKSSLERASEIIREALTIEDEAIRDKCSMNSPLVVLPPNGMKVFQEEKDSGVSGRSNNGEAIDRDDIAQLLKTIEGSIEAKAPDYQIVDIIPDLYRYGNRTSETPPYGEKAKQITANASIHCVPKELFETYSSAFKAANVTPEGYGVAPYAAAKLISLENPDLKAYLILDLGGYGSKVSLIGEGRLFQTLCLPVGMNHLTEALAKSFSIPFDKAEELKKTYGYSLRKSKFETPIATNANGQSFRQEDLNNVLKAWFMEYDVKLKNAIDELLEPTIKQNLEQHKDKIISCPIFLIGGGANLSGIKELLMDASDTHPLEAFVPSVIGARDPKYVNILGLLVAECTSDTPSTDMGIAALSRVNDR